MKKTYCEWLYFAAEGTHIFASIWDVYALKTPENIAKIRKDNPNGVYIEDYPP
jgi:hypothetical protein